MTNYEFMNRMLSALGLPPPEKVFEPQWFALKNFHGMRYKDADVLEDYLHFRANVPVDDYFASMKARLPWYYSLAFLAPAWAVKMFMKPYVPCFLRCRNISLLLYFQNPQKPRIFQK